MNYIISIIHPDALDAMTELCQQLGMPMSIATHGRGTATRSMILDGRVMVEKAESKMYGQPFTGHGMQGYDNVTGKHWGTWNDSMSKL